jgi:hypothetical protein
MALAKSHAVLSAELLSAETPAEVIYFQNFDAITGSNPDGWTATVGTASVSVASLQVQAAFPNQSYEARTSRTFDVEAGRDYTFTASARNAATNSGGFVQVDGGTPVPLDGVSFAPVSVAFTATASTVVVLLGGSSYWDDITLTREPYAATPLPLDVIEASVTLNETRAPYAEARLTVHAPDPETLEAIDPRDGVRVTLEAELSWDEPTKADQTRTFDLLLHERTINHEAGTLELILESDEALLIDGGNATA